jgi:hypothetical protein
MAETIKGLNVVIGYDTVGLSKALGEVDKQSRSLASELRSVEKLLKFDPSNTELLSQKQKLLADAIATTKTRLDTLKEAQSQVNDQFAKGEISEGKYRAFQREIAKTEQELKRLESQAKKSGVSLEQIAKATEKAAQRFNALGNTLLRTVAAPLLALGGAAYKMASDTQEAVNKVEVAFGDASRSVKAWAKTTLDSYGLAEGTALDVAALFGDMATAMGFSQTKAAEMSTTLVGLAADLASFKNIGIDQAQTALKAIFTGETESLKNLGVVMTQANLQAYALSKGINKTVQEMTQAEQVSLRYSYVMDMTKNAQGDFSRTSDGAANSMRVFQESVKELAAEFGENLLPMITPVIKDVTDFIKKLGDLDEKTQNNIITIAKWAAGAGIALKGIGLLTGGVDALIKKYQKATEWAAKAAAGNVAVGTSAAGATPFVVGLGKAAQFLLGPWGLVIGGTSALVGLLALLNDAEYDATLKMQDMRREASTLAGTLDGDLSPSIYNVAQAMDAVDEAQKRVNTGMGIGNQRARFVKEKGVDVFVKALDELKAKTKEPPTPGGGKTWLDDVHDSIRSLTIDAELARLKIGLLTGETTDEAARLTRQLELQHEELAAQAKAVDALSEALERMKKEQGANSMEAKQLTLELLKAKQAYQDIQAEIDATNEKFRKQRAYDEGKPWEAEGRAATNEEIKRWAAMSYIQQQLESGAAMSADIIRDILGTKAAAAAQPQTVTQPTSINQPVTIQETVNIYGDANRHEVAKGMDDANTNLVSKLRLAKPGVVS